MTHLKKGALITMLALFVLIGAGCSKEAKPMSEQEQAAAKGMSLEEYRDMKEAAARMNMGVEEHMNMDDEDMMEMK